MTVTIETISNAARLLEGRVERTPCTLSRTLSGIAGAEIYLKMENE